ncbi:MAG: alcohol dehydrogenase catalytic domain-containing protein [Culicoidibacterales bacterium]
MFSKTYRLINPKQFEIHYEQLDFSNEQTIIVKPTYLSICAADQRYYQGNRPKHILAQKLPMALIHEAVGEVVFDPKGKYEKGTMVALIPNTPEKFSEIYDDYGISENYSKSSKFRGSGFDGFMQEYVQIRRDRVVNLKDINPEVGSFIELVSVLVHALTRFEKYSSDKKMSRIGIWGDGNLGYMLAHLIKILYPEITLIIFGKNDEKLEKFYFADDRINIDDFNGLSVEKISVDHAFEAVGGKASEFAIEQIIKSLTPEGTLSLLGVSEEPVKINTRDILEKGIIVLGNSRSGVIDFEKAVEVISQNKWFEHNLLTLISEVVEINEVNDIHRAFKDDMGNTFKTVMKWSV